MTNPLPILQELPSEQDIGGASGAQRFLLQAYGKKNSDEFPYNVPNEKIASELARIVGLPVPEVLLYQHRGEWMFFSRSVGTVDSGESRPPGTSSDVAKAIANWPGIIEETVCFDLFVCNNDRDPQRSGGNFLCDEQGQLWLIDYGNALFYRPSDRGRIQPGISRLQSIEADFSALFDKPYGFLESCRTWEAMQRAFERIAAIPDYFVENTISRLPNGLLTGAEQDFAVAFLNRRKGQMETIIRTNAEHFPNLVIPSPK